jgi:hypothetical protein
VGWAARTAGGPPTPVPPGRTMAITPYTTIDFGKTVGVIEP